MFIIMIVETMMIIVVDTCKFTTWLTVTSKMTRIKVVRKMVLIVIMIVIA
jgi:hypothetical protein